MAGSEDIFCQIYYKMLFLLISSWLGEFLRKAWHSRACIYLSEEEGLVNGCQMQNLPTMSFPPESRCLMTSGRPNTHYIFNAFSQQCNMHGRFKYGGLILRKEEIPGEQMFAYRTHVDGGTKWQKPWWSTLQSHLPHCRHQAATFCFQLFVANSSITMTSLWGSQRKCSTIMTCL